MFNSLFVPSIAKVIQRDLTESRLMLHEAEAKAAFYSAMVDLYRNNIKRLEAQVRELPIGGDAQ